MNPVRASLRHPQVAYVLTGIVCVAGLYALLQMPRREDPQITVRQGLVLAAYPGATAEQVERQVTEPVEDQLFGYAEVKKGWTYSTSSAGVMAVHVELEDWVVDPDPFWSKLRHDLNELRVIDLPEGVRGPIVNSDFGDVTALLIGVSGERYGYRDLKDYVQRISSELRRIPSVSKVNTLGEQSEQIVVSSTMQRLAQYGLSPLQIVQGIHSANRIVESGALDADESRARLWTTGLYATEEQIRRQIVGMSPQGQPIYLGDFTNVERTYVDPSFLVRVDGEPALMLSLEMQEGNNIVEFGTQVDDVLNDLRRELPPDLHLTVVADQPRVVSERIGHFLREFALAVAAVIAVTMILLPFTVAAIAATAIPVTVAVTFAAMQALGIELHQVSLAALIVVLGMVVDDAIVIADHYVELLQEGLASDEASWRSASDLAVPVLAATLTIIAAFVPMAFLTGSTGEFIRALPITVAVALSCSYVVAMLLTPLLCRAFIREGHGLARAREEEGDTSKGFLGALQRLYDGSIRWTMARKRLTMAVGVGIVVAGVLLQRQVRQLFFSTAERAQFAMNVSLPEGSALAATEDVVSRIEGVLAQDDRVTSQASFVGGGAPRFYYSFEPLIPARNVAQIIVNTTSVDATVALVVDLRRRLPAVVPEAEVLVTELQQGPPRWSPVEARISGPDLQTLKQIGDRVERIVEQTPGSYFVRSNFREDVYVIQVGVDSEVANRVGIDQALVSETLAGTLLGMPVSTFWEGSRAVDIVLRLDETRRETVEDVEGIYLVSPIGARVPLREVASLEPVWQTGRIVHRNGVRTLTVGSHAANGWLPFDVLREARPVVDTLSLPAGYRIAWGGEIEQQQITFGELRVALMVSLVSIFLILLLQFQSVKDALVVMTTFPLAIFGAAAGLLLTGNPFGFTAFIGLISLTGVVVRNAIILIDYVRERQATGMPLKEAALEAGKRRLRPIFLTTAAAAVGVTPMILSGSLLWSPLASVIAVGLLFSMVFTLIVVPVLYVLVNRGADTARGGTYAAT